MPGVGRVAFSNRGLTVNVTMITSGNAHLRVTAEGCDPAYRRGVATVGLTGAPTAG